MHPQRGTAEEAVAGRDDGERVSPMGSEVRLLVGVRGFEPPVPITWVVVPDQIADALGSAG